MKDLLILILLCVVLYQVASDKPWWQPLKHNTVEAVQGLVSGDASKFKELFSFKTLESFPEAVDTSENDSLSTSASAGASQAVGATSPTANQQSAVVMKDGPTIDPSALSPTGSTGGTYSVSPGSIILQTNTENPKAWVSFNVNVASEFNYIYFELDFTSPTPAQGLFNTYMDVQDLGYMDERFFGTSAKRQTAGFPITQPGTHTITFRLDQSGPSPSSVTVKNIGTGMFTE